jgi:hypothetical protein
MDFIEARESELPGCPPMAVLHFMNRYEDMVDAWTQVSESWDRARQEHISLRCSSTPQSTPKSTPKSTPQSTPKSTPQSTPQSTPESTQQPPSAQKSPLVDSSRRRGDLRRTLGLSLSGNLSTENLALIERVPFFKGPQPVQIAAENSSQLGLRKSKYATQNAPAAPGARLQGHHVVPDNTVPDKTPSQKPGPVPTNTPSNAPAAPGARLQGHNTVSDKTPSQKPGPVPTNTPSIAPAAPGARLQGYNVVPDKTTSNKPGPTPKNTRPYQIDRIADKRRNLEGRWDATRPGDLHCHESQRPGGHAPWASFRKVGNQDSVRDARYLNLCNDEQLKACMNMYGRGSGCRHVNKPENCPNNHEVKPWQLQWLVENRNLHPDVAFFMVHYYNLHRPRHSLALEKLPRSVQPGIAGAGVPLTKPAEAKGFYYK